jgi:hypothetical protein
VVGVVPAVAVAASPSWIFDAAKSPVIVNETPSGTSLTRPWVTFRNHPDWISRL